MYEITRYGLHSVFVFLSVCLSSVFPYLKKVKLQKETNGNVACI